MRSTISVSLSSRGKYQNPTKLQDLATTKINEANPNQYTTSILMAVSHQKNWEKNFEHLHKKDEGSEKAIRGRKGEWEPIKLPRRNLAYVLNITQHTSSSTAKTT
jgi:hypothetical protein